MSGRHLAGRRPPPWAVRSSRLIHRDRWISLRADDCVNDEGVEFAPWYVLENPDEAPLAAGQRELAEETGYTARDWRLLASIPVNPSNHNNLTHIVLATGVALTGVPGDDPHERVRAQLRPASEVVALARAGGITQAMHVTGLALGLTELGLWG